MLVDSHCHLDFPDFDDDRDAIVQRARDAGLVRMVTICTRVRKFAQVLAVADGYPDIFCSVGTHPHNSHEELDIGVDELIEKSTHPKVVAIGEAGLDYYYRKDHAEAQAQHFAVHIEAARRTGLPLVIHSRDADDDMIDILERETANGAFPFVLHCFSSGAQLAEIGVSLGGYVSFSGIAAFKRSDSLREIAAKVPAERVLMETDAPYLAPPPNRGKRNEPGFVADTAAILAKHLNVDFNAFAAQTTENFYRLFSKVPRHDD
ncbi:MAG: TatD family hydrolase [Pseudomonadota bacterium]